MIIGASTGGGTLSLPSAAASFAVFFQPTGFSRLFGVPMVEISHHVYDDAVLGFRLRGLHGQLADCDSFVRRVAIIEAFLLERAAQCVQSSSLEHLAAAIFADQGAVRVSGLACMQGLGLRQFERRFLAETGLQPKLYARIARFQSALDAKINLPTRPWIDIAHCLGYHDEMHLVRDFHGFTGSAPGKILSLIGDTRPTALVGL
jgi:AraC-like DNA-binding protein